MNYFAHGFRHLHRPYFLAGTALPDWLSVYDRSLRIRRENLARLPVPASDDDAELRAGVEQHLADDERFHDNPAFIAVSTTLTSTIRERYPHPPNLRSHFLGHVLTEILLDAELMDETPDQLDRYYAALDEVDPTTVVRFLEKLVGTTTLRFAELIGRFRTERFIADYRDDSGVIRRLEQVVRRVGLPPLPGDFVEVLPTARALVAGATRELSP